MNRVLLIILFIVIVVLVARYAWHEGVLYGMQGTVAAYNKMQNDGTLPGTTTTTATNTPPPPVDYYHLMQVENFFKTHTNWL
jgi:hypothetical protein